MFGARDERRRRDAASGGATSASVEELNCGAPAGGGQRRTAATARAGGAEQARDCINNRGRASSVGAPSHSSVVRGGENSKKSASASRCFSCCAGRVRARRADACRRRRVEHRRRLYATKMAAE